MGEEIGPEAKAAFHLGLRGRGVRDLAVLRAAERVPRQLFVADRYAALAMRDLPVPIACGQTLPPAWLAARMIEALAVAPDHRVLQVGSGSGYTTALLAQLCDRVVGMERIRSLAAAAAARLEGLGIRNAAVLWGDGGREARGGAPFDRILVHALVEAVPAALLRRLAGNGVLVCARPAADGQNVVRHENGVGALVETTVCACRLPALREGVARSL